MSKRRNWDRLFSLRYERVVGKDHVVQFRSHHIQLPARQGKQGYAGQRVELSHQLDGQLHVWLGEQRLCQMPLALGYRPGRAPRRPRSQKRKLPRIYVYAGRAALAVRPGKRNGHGKKTVNSRSSKRGTGSRFRGMLRHSSLGVCKTRPRGAAWPAGRSWL